MTEKSLRISTLFMLGIVLGAAFALAAPDIFVDTRKLVADALVSPPTNRQEACCSTNLGPVPQLIADHRDR